MTAISLARIAHCSSLQFQFASHILNLEIPSFKSFILAWVSSVIQQLEEILTSSFNLGFWQGNQMSSWLLQVAVIPNMEHKSLQLGHFLKEQSHL